MSASLSSAAGRVTGILGKMSDLSSSYNEAMRLMGGLGGSLAVLTEFIKRRVGDGNEVDPEAMKSITGTLGEIEEKIDEIRLSLGKRWGCIPYGKWMVYGAPLTAPCFGRAGSTRIIKQLRDLEDDLSGEIKFLELQMTANAVRSLEAISRARTAIAMVFDSASARSLWVEAFGERTSAGQSEFAAVLRGAASAPRASRARDLCCFLAAGLSVDGTVGAREFSASVGGRAVSRWIANSLVVGPARTVTVPGHYGAVSAIACTDGFMVTGGADSAVKVFALSERGVPALRGALVGHRGRVNCVGVCGEEGVVYSGSDDGTVRTWSLYSGECTGVITATSGVRAMACGGGAVAYACAAPSMSIDVVDAGSREVVSKAYGHAGGVSSLSVLPSTGGGAPRVYSSGADRAVKLWTPSRHDPVSVARQAHPVSVRHVLSHPDFVASVSDRDVRFYPSGELSAPAPPARLCGRVEGGGAVCGACVLGTSPCVVVATSELFGDSANARLHAVFPGDKGKVRFASSIRTLPGESPCSVSSHDGTVYVGFSSGGVRWFSLGPDGFSEEGSVGDAARGSGAVLAEDVSLPLLAARGDRALTAHPPGVLSFHPSGKAVVLDGPATAVSPSEGGCGWAVGCGGSLLTFGDDGVQAAAPVPMGGRVMSLMASTIRRKLFGDVRSSPMSRTICVIDPASGVRNDLVREPVASDAPCAPGLVLNDRYLVWPGYHYGTLAVMDTVELRAHDPVQFCHLEIDPLTGVASSGTWFVTLHGGLDALLWPGVRDGPARRLRTYAAPVSSLAVAGDGRLVAGLADGTVVADDEAAGQAGSPSEKGEVFVGHAPGGVAVAPAGMSGFFSLGAEGSLIRHALR